VELDPLEFARAALNQFPKESRFSVGVRGHDPEALLAAFALLGCEAELELDPARPYIHVSRHPGDQSQT